MQDTVSFWEFLATPLIPLGLFFLFAFIISGYPKKVIKAYIRDKRAPKSPPAPLDRIRYVRVRYINKFNTNDRGTLDYRGSVQWSAYDNCWEIFKYCFKESIDFLDINKNIIPMQRFRISTQDVVEGDCGKVLIR